MVLATCICFVIPLFVQAVVTKAQEEFIEPPTEVPKANVPQYDYDIYGTFDYGKQYGDYLGQYEVYQYNDYGDYDNAWQYDYIYYDDYETHYADVYGYGDRNNPLDAVVQTPDDSEAMQMAWVYMIVPVVQVDVFFIGDEEKAIEEIELQLPIETFLFQLGDFPLELGSLVLAGDYEFIDYGLTEYGDYDYQYYGEYPYYGQYGGYGRYDYDANPKANMYDTADQLDEFSTLDYPGIDHDSFWVDWIFMLPPDEIIR